MHILSDRTLLISLSDEFVEALAAAKVPDPFKELLNKRIEYEKHEKDQTDEAAARDAFEKAAAADALAIIHASMHGPPNDEYVISLPCVSMLTNCLQCSQRRCRGKELERVSSSIYCLSYSNMSVAELLVTTATFCMASMKISSSRFVARTTMNVSTMWRA